MKVFISYGHDDYTQVVDRLFDALVREGHEPWKDDRYEGNSGIPAGQDFTQVIYQAIDAADFVVAFVTAKTKDKPYCCDERQYAYNRKGNHFIQIRMDGVEVTLGNARSYIDMTDVVGGDRAVKERLFEEKLKALFAAFRDPASFAEGGFTPWAKFDTHLKVPGALKYRDFVASLDGGDFVGRQWLLEKCKNWAMDSSIACRLFVILGEAGTGKTAFVRRLAEDEELVRSVHICVYDKPSTRTARDTLKDLAYVLAQNNKDYFEFLKMRDFEQLKDMTLDGLFEFLFVDPLKNETQKYLLVIDGLDEMEENTGFKPLMKLFRQYAQQLNPNISFLVTGRPDSYITDMLRTVSAGKPPESIMLDKNASKEDLRHYIKRKLEQLGCYSRSLAETLLDACDGNFEYLSLLFREALEEGLQVFDGMKLPRGLNERYVQYLDRRLEMDGSSRLTRDQRRLLALLCVAYEPLPVTVLGAVSGLDDYEIFDELELFGSLIRRVGETGEDTRICLFTKSFRDFLLSKQFEKYCADRKLGTQLFARSLMEKCPTEKALKKHPYMERYGFVYLLHYAEEEPEEVVAYCKSLQDTGMDLALWIAGALHEGEAAALQGFWRIKADLNVYASVIAYLKGKRSADALQEIIALRKSEGKLVSALSLEADMLLWNPTPEAYRQAEELYRQVLELNEENYRNAPTYDNRRSLSIIYGRLGDLARDKRTAEGDAEAEQWFLKKLALEEQSYSENPCYESRRGLAIIYGRLGDYARDKQTPESSAQAEQWYQKRLSLYEQNYAAQPCYESRRDLAIAYQYMGRLEGNKDTPAGTAKAAECYQEALKLYEKNHQDNPCYESRRGLSIICLRLGDLARGKQTPEGDAEAQRWYLKMVEMDERNLQESPSYESRRDLAIDYQRLGDLARRQKTTEGTAEAERYYQEALGFYEQNYRSNPAYQSRRDLGIIWQRLADLARRKQTPEGDAEAQRWYCEVLECYEENIRIHPTYESRRDLSVIYLRLGDLARDKLTPEGDAEAEEWYRKMLETDRLNHQANPTVESRRDLAIDHQRLGDLARRKQTPEGDAEAQQRYREALIYYTQNAQIHPSYDSRRDLGINYQRLGDMARRKNTPEGDVEAGRWYREALTCYEQNMQSYPTYESRRDLSIIYIRLGDLARDKRTPEGYVEAEEWYRKMLEMDRLNHQANPTVESRRDLSVDYQRLGDLARRKQTPEGNAEAEKWCRKRVEMDEQNHAINPGYRSRRSLSVSYNFLGDMARDKRTPEGYAEAEEWYRKMLAFDEQNYRTNPCAESRRDLSITYGRLAGLARRKGTPESLAEAKEWTDKQQALLSE
ncbi:MAG: TIR domain-containing protein [Clostridia bacterium]|nr:TIR domain-containing protein [Clostridia bacterium]